MRAALLTLLAIALPSVGMAQTPGWRRVDLGGGAYAQRYLPHSVRPCDPLPLVLFLHGAGGTPDGYEGYVEAPAESLGIVLIMPAATGAGWGSADTANISAALDAISAEVNVDGTRTYFAGHSAGAAYAYLLGYESATGIAAIFTLSAPSYMVSGLAEPTYRAPIHMYYGDTDPNYTMGAEAQLVMQWNGLGIPHEEDIQAGYGHSTWPDSSMLAGFTFLLAHHYPGTPPASTCAGGGDAGVPPVDAGTPITDAGAHDGGSTPSDGSVTHDGATSGADLGTGTHHATGGCGCDVVGRERGAGAFVLLGLFLLGTARARRERSVSRP